MSTENLRSSASGNKSVFVNTVCKTIQNDTLAEVISTCKDIRKYALEMKAMAADGDYSEAMILESHQNKQFRLGLGKLKVLRELGLGKNLYAHYFSNNVCILIGYIQALKISVLTNQDTQPEYHDLCAVYEKALSELAGVDVFAFNPSYHGARSVTEEITQFSWSQ